MVIKALYVRGEELVIVNPEDAYYGERVVAIDYHLLGGNIFEYNVRFASGLRFAYDRKRLYYESSLAKPNDLSAMIAEQKLRKEQS